MPDLSSLPLELIIKVVALLNSNDLISLLKALPWLKSIVILITDHDKSPLLFDISGIKRRSFPSPLCEGNRYHKHTDRECIKLVEITHHKHMDLLVDIRPELLHPYLNPDCPIDFDSTTFAFFHSDVLHSEEARQQRMFLLAERLDQFAPGAKWTIGSPRTIFDSLSDDSLVHTVDGLGQIVDGSKLTELPNFSSSLKRLRITNTISIQGITLPQCTDFFVGLDKNGEKRPQMVDVVLGNVQRLVIHYKGFLPVFKGIRCEGRATDRTDDQFHDSFFEICDLENSQGNYTPSTINRQNFKYLENVDSTTLDLFFLKRFRTAHLLGVPDVFVLNAEFQAISTLLWLKSIPEPKQLALEHYNSRMNTFVAITLIVTAPGSIVPQPYYFNGVKSVDVLVLAPYVIITSFMYGMVWSDSAPVNTRVYRSLEYYSGQEASDETFLATWDEIGRHAAKTWTRWFRRSEFHNSVRITGLDMFARLNCQGMLQWNNCNSVFVKFHVTRCLIKEASPGVGSLTVTLPLLNCRVLHFIDIHPIVSRDLFKEFPSLSLHVNFLCETWEGITPYFSYRAPVGFDRYTFGSPDCVLDMEISPGFMRLLKYRFPELINGPVLEVVLQRWCTKSSQTKKFNIRTQCVNGDDPIYVCYVPVVRTTGFRGKVYDAFS